ncbi:2,3-epoxybenzoyl-CoA dihydrolase [Motiliproteus sp. MSK22-1]|uniref:2,3-epoxybenzoyl-CoA dihydrolase n=1 Tax=Motiliproteus sp. MSK22-1 TaxID=1897630 RepID=UPI0009760542|nr:2,3-epoxybenzoyl-CoA dihydrolase [Motiliproteus sp. MSK22-1]OMH29114.1 benzoyl-CoA-dihydrodiol lyase [Motiliproteus sp. MSK22-1]
MINFRTQPDSYRHWQLTVNGSVAHLTLSVDEQGGLFDGYELKMNSYDLGVDIELYDAVQRLRFEYPQVGAVVISSSNNRIFCSGANIRMLAGSSHAHKVNFCKFTNETRNSIEDASENSGQRYICAINGTAAGGGYELALATDYIMLIDDGSSTVSLPEVPLLAVLPGTGGLTRLVDKRKVRRDRSDIFCTTEEGIGGQKAVDWRLVDEVIPGSQFTRQVKQRAEEFSQQANRSPDAKGICLTPLERSIEADTIRYPDLNVTLNREKSLATLTLKGPESECLGENHPHRNSLFEDIQTQGDKFWPLALARQLDDALLHLRSNEPELGTLIFRTEGEVQAVFGYDQLLRESTDYWLVREIMLYWKRTLKRIDMTSRSSFALVDQGSCFSGFLAELLFSVDRSYMLEGQYEDDPRPSAKIRLSPTNFGPLPMPNGLSRLETRFLGEPDSLELVANLIAEDLDAEAAQQAGLITEALDDIDWDDEIRMVIEERASFSPDALTGMEANLRFAGPETMETKIFGRLSAWQNWIFQRPNAVGEKGALRLYGSGGRPEYNKERV